MKPNAGDDRSAVVVKIMSKRAEARCDPTHYGRLHELWHEVAYVEFSANVKPVDA